MEKKIKFKTSDWFFLVIIQLCLFALPIWFIHDFYFSNSRLSRENPVFVNALIFVFILFDIYIIDNFFRFREMVLVSSTLGLQEKVAVVDSLQSVFRWGRYKGNTEQYIYRFLYWGKINKVSLTITIAVESDGFYINVMDAGKCMLLDFWYYRYMTKKIKSTIENKLAERRHETACL
ncbi:MAG: hypothetical protein ACJ75B_03600 [Flavisolibacter sp.]